MSSKVVFSNSLVTVEQHDNVYLLLLRGGKNLVNPTLMDSITQALDFIEFKTEGPAALVTTSTDPKFFSNGLDLQWIAQNRLSTVDMLRQFQRLLARLLTYPIPTVAAINGHAVAAGAMLSLAHDIRFMREDRGIFWLSEIDIGLPFAPGMNAIIKEKIGHVSAWRDAMFFGRKFSAREAMEAKIVDRVCSMEQLVGEAIKAAQSLSAKGADRKTLKMIKQEALKDVVAVLEAGEMPDLSGLAKL